MPTKATLRMALTPLFAAKLAKAGIVIEPLGTTTNPSPRILEFPIGKSVVEGYATTGGIVFKVNNTLKASCPTLSVYALGNNVNCVMASGESLQLLRVINTRSTSNNGPWITDSHMAIAIANKKAATRLNNALGVNIFRSGQVVGEMRSDRQILAKASDRDPKSDCLIDDWASDNSINRGWAVQAMVNSIPTNVTVSQLINSGGKATLNTPSAPSVAIGQKTPYMNGGETGDHKGIIRGTSYKNDNFYDGYNYGCTTTAPYVVGQGDLGKATAWTYDGEVRTPATAGNARDTWWGIPRQTNYDGPTGWYTWACRANPTDKTDTFWERVSQGSGFTGDSAWDRQTKNSKAGRAPSCRDDNFSNLNLTTRYSISKRGGLEARSDQNEYPRYCTVAGSPLAGCWQEIYPSTWDRAWNFQYHVYASSLGSRITSDARIKVPADYDQVGGVGFTKPISWRVTDATVTGAWPKWLDQNGKAAADMSGVTATAGSQDWSTPSPFTVLGASKQAFTLAGYGKPMGRQTMTYTLTADTDGTWIWPVDADGNELPRPQVKLTTGFVVSNFDNGGTCNDKIWYDDSWFSGTNDDAGNRCIQGQVPTIWPLPEKSSDMSKLAHDDFITKDGKTEKVVPTTTFESTVVESCWTKSQLKVQDLSTPEAPAVGASYTWDIKLTGLIDSWSGCV